MQKSFLHNFKNRFHMGKSIFYGVAFAVLFALGGCKKEVKAVTITECQVLKVSNMKDKANLFLVIRQASIILYNQLTSFKNVTNNTVLPPLSMSARIDDFNRDVTFQFYQSEIDKQSLLIGGLEGRIFDEGKPETLTLSTPTGSFIIRLKLSYEY